MSKKAVEKDNKVLPETVQMAWDSYLNMAETKQIYYEFMQSLDQKYQLAGSPSEHEHQQLKNMLQAHSETVRKFNQAMQSVVDPDDRTLLLKKMN